MNKAKYNKKLKSMTFEELKKHRQELTRKHYIKNHDKIVEKQKSICINLYHFNPEYRNRKLINTLKNSNKLTIEEIEPFNNNYNLIKQYTKNKRRYNEILLELNKS